MAGGHPCPHHGRDLWPPQQHPDTRSPLHAAPCRCSVSHQGPGEWQPLPPSTGRRQRRGVGRINSDFAAARQLQKSFSGGGDGAGAARGRSRFVPGPRHHGAEGAAHLEDAAFPRRHRTVLNAPSDFPLSSSSRPPALFSPLASSVPSPILSPTVLEPSTPGPRPCTIPRCDGWKREPLTQCHVWQGQAGLAPP